MKERRDYLAKSMEEAYSQLAVWGLKARLLHRGPT